MVQRLSSQLHVTLSNLGPTWKILGEVTEHGRVCVSLPSLADPEVR